MKRTAAQLAKEALERSLLEARAGASVLRAADLDPVADGHHASRFAYGATLPVAVLRRVWRDAPAKRSFLRIKLTQVAFMIVTSILFTWAFLVREHFGKSGSALTVEAWVAFLSSFYGLLCFVEWSIIALSKDHDDQLARKASLLAGVPPEDEEARARVRVDVPWMWRKAKRRVRGLVVIATGFPLMAITLIVPGMQLAYPVLVFAWTAYWVAAFTAAKSSAAWADEARWPAYEPFFLRGATLLTTHAAGFRWWAPRAYSALWRKTTRSMFAPCRLVELAPRELFGLAAARAVLGIPGVYLVMRPLFRVAAARVVIGATRSEAARPAAAAPTAAGETHHTDPHPTSAA